MTAQVIEYNERKAITRKIHKDWDRIREFVERTGFTEGQAQIVGDEVLWKHHMSWASLDARLVAKGMEQRQRFVIKEGLVRPE